MTYIIFLFYSICFTLVFVPKMFYKFVTDFACHLSATISLRLELEPLKNAFCSCLLFCVNLKVFFSVHVAYWLPRLSKLKVILDIKEHETLSNG